MAKEIQPGAIINNYEIISLIATTNFSNVYKANSPTNGEVAIKVIKNNDIKTHEIELMKSIECPYIMTAIDIFEHDNNKCIVMPFAEYNALSYINKILQVSEEPREEIAKRIVKATLEALHFLHSRNICHRDVKTENLLISGNLDVSPSVMLSDLGLAKQIGEGKKCDDEFVGTLKFAAPEIITHTPYDQSADIWSLGVTTYYLLSGTSPFPLSPECCLRRCIEKGAYFYPQRTWKGISEKAKNLIDRMICVDPIKRITAKEALDHPWFDKEE